MMAMLEAARALGWRGWCCVAALVALAGLGGYAAGRWATPARVEVRTEVQTKWETRTVVEVREVRVQQRAAQRIIYRDRWVTDAGTREQERILEREDQSATTDTASVAATATAGSQQVSHERLVTHERPGWYVGADVGGQWHGRPWLPITGPLVLGIRAERRVVGGLWAGVWLNTGGAAGGSLGFSF